MAPPPSIHPASVYAINSHLFQGVACVHKLSNFILFGTRTQLINKTSTHECVNAGLRACVRALAVIERHTTQQPFASSNCFVCARMCVSFGAGCGLAFGINPGRIQSVKSTPLRLGDSTCHACHSRVCCCDALLTRRVFAAIAPNCATATEFRFLMFVCVCVGATAN